MHIVNAATMQSLDRRTIEELGLPGLVLMERASLGTVAAMQRHLGDRLAEVHVLAGTGNNGGDGLAIARLLHEQSRVKVWLLGDDAKRSPDNRHQLTICERLGIETVAIGDDESETLRAGLGTATTIVDALFGVGLSRNLEGLWAEAVDIANECKVSRVAVDLPSGIHGDTGAVLGTAFQADLTVSFAFPKWGHLLDPALDYVGRLEVVEIGIPASYAEGLRESLIDGALARVWRPAPRRKDSHKGTYGRLGIVAGSLGMGGAARMAAEAALQTGTGLVFLFVPASIQDQLAVALPEVQVVPLPEAGGQLAPEALDILQRRLADMDAILLGPGLGRSEPLTELLSALLEILTQPLVLDADALWHLAGHRRSFTQPVVLTPHPGELGRLLDLDTAGVQADRVSAVRRASADYQAVTVLKGARSLVAAPDGELWFNTTGNPGMARGGMGDVLAGLSAGLLAQGLEPAAAAGLACYWHGLVGDTVAASLPEQAVTVQRLLAALPEAWGKIGSRD